DAHIHTESGSSGGPLFDETGRIVGVCRSGEVKNSSHAVFSPSEKIQELLHRKQPEYIVDYDYTSAGRNFLYNRPVYSAVSGTVGLGAIGGTGFALARFPKPTLGALGVAGLGMMWRDLQIHSDTFDSHESSKYGFASGADATFAGGALLNLAVQ